MKTHQMTDEDWMRELGMTAPPLASRVSVDLSDPALKHLMSNADREKDELIQLNKTEQEGSMLASDSQKQQILAQAEAEKERLMEQMRREKEQLERELHQTLAAKQAELQRASADIDAAKTKLQDREAALTAARLAAQKQIDEAKRKIDEGDRVLKQALEESAALQEKSQSGDALKRELEEKNAQIERLKVESEEAKRLGKMATEEAERQIRQQHEELESLRQQVDDLMDKAKAKNLELQSEEFQKTQLTKERQDAAEKQRAMSQNAITKPHYDSRGVCTVDENGDRQCHYTRCTVM